jgi:adenylate kinase
MSVRIVLVGPPGSGKGTQGAAMAARLGIPHLSTGDLLRREIAERTPRGEQLALVVQSGELVPDVVMAELVSDAVRRAGGGFILDGFPRTAGQADFLDGLMDASASPIDAVLVFRVPEAELVARLRARARADDTGDAIQLRLDLSRHHEEELLRHYRGRVVEVDALGEIESITDRALDALREQMRGVG